MPPSKVSTRTRLLGFVKYFGSEVLSIDGAVLHCKVCEKMMVADRKSQVEQHIRCCHRASTDTVFDDWHSTRMNFMARARGTPLLVANFPETTCGTVQPYSGR